MLIICITQKEYQVFDEAFQQPVDAPFDFLAFLQTWQELKGTDIWMTPFIVELREIFLPYITRAASMLQEAGCTEDDRLLAATMQSLQFSPDETYQRSRVTVDTLEFHFRDIGGDTPGSATTGEGKECASGAPGDSSYMPAEWEIGCTPYALTTPGPTAQTKAVTHKRAGAVPRTMKR